MPSIQNNDVDNKGMIDLKVNEVKKQHLRLRNINGKYVYVQTDCI